MAPCCTRAMGQLNSRRIFLAALYVSALAACAEPATDSPAAKPRAGTIPDENIPGEQLLAQPPDGWKQGYVTKTPVLRLAEFIPEGDTAADWQEKVTFESLRGDPLPDPIDFVAGIGDDQSTACERFEHVNIQSGLENNYPTSVRLLTCMRNKLTDKGEVSLVKAIQGNDHFYVITRTKRVPPIGEGDQPISDEEMAEWSLFMRAITVCDTNREQHHCG